MTPPAVGRGPARRARLEQFPRSPVEAPGSGPDLVARLRASQRALRSRLTSRAALDDVVAGTQATLDPADIAAFLATWARRWLPVPGWAVAVTDPEGQLTVLAERGMTGQLGPAVQAIAGWVLHSGEEFYASADLRFDSRLPGPSVAVSAVGFLLKGRERPVGVLVGIDRKPSAAPPVLGPAVLAGWSALLTPAAIAIENALLVHRAEALSVTDDLTRLYNSRFLNQALRRETKRAIRTGRPLSLLFIDLDGFKAVNDTFGHLHGSRALVEAASVIRTCARESDVVARFGGDEFAVVLPETDREGAVMVAERIRERIAEHSFLTADLLDVRLTASVGVASLPDVAASADELMQAADRAMYKVKVSGKNGIQLAVD